MSTIAEFDPATESHHHPDGHRPTHDEIALLAVHIWEEEGCPFGREQANWHEAERRLKKFEHGDQPRPVAAVSAHERDRLAEG